MVEIKAKLTRLPVYFANELVNCVVTFTNNKESGELEQLAWCVVQIHCLLHTDENKIQMPAHPKDSRLLKDKQANNRDTSFHPLKGERGQVVFSTKPKFLFCDLKLKSGESQLFHFNDQLPDHSPPSYNRSAIKYFYKITIGIQRVNSTIQLLRMPLKVLSLPINVNDADDDQQASEDDVFTGVHSDHDGDPQVTKTTSHNQQNTDIISLILHKLDCLSSKRTLSSYIITNPLGRVGKFCIFKSVFKLGEDVIGFFDFNDSEIPCVQYTVTLQSEETINEDYRSSKLKHQRAAYSPHLTNYSQCQEFCIHSLNTQISLPIPLTITPTFETKIIRLKWRLYFEFVTTRPEQLDAEIYEDDYGEMKLSPKCMDVQTMVWDLPITILPTNPTKIGQGLQLPDTSRIVV